MLERDLGASGTGDAHSHAPGYGLAEVEDGALREAVMRALRERYDPGPQSGIILESCLCIIFAELSRFADQEARKSKAPLGMLPGALRLIEERSADISLSRRPRPASA
jgi:hypothetical protein